MGDRVGQRLGNYRLLRLLGRGGFAEVYLGEHVFLGTQAAIKLLQVQLEQDLFKGFLEEARMLAHLEHAHIVRVLDFGLQDATPFLVQSYAQAGSLRQRHAKGTPLPLERILAYSKEIASALDYAHAQRLIHRDVKPENMLIGKNDELLLSDFGVAVFARRFQQASSQEISGTVAYMAPEQLRGEACAASDQYALGVVIYEWLTGACPFQGTFAQIYQQHIGTAPPPLHERIADISPIVEQVVLRALAKDPLQRFASAGAFVLALEQAVMGEKPAAQPGDGDPLWSPVLLPILEEPAQATHTPPFIWNVPHRRNPFFTGREESLQLLHELFSRFREVGQAMHPLALCGLGGIGKTQTAIEYAYRYREHYMTILWARADSYETLLTDVMAIGQLLRVIGQDEQDQQRSREAVKHWLQEQTRWLLILDNVEDFAMMQQFLPTSHRGAVLLTTRTQITATLARAIDLEKMDLDEGALFLLRRAKMLDLDAEIEDAAGADYIEARDIVRMMGGLPLALDQAGAYIEETGCSLADYMNRYRQQRRTLLDLRGDVGTGHPAPVSQTWLLSFEKLEQLCPAATELLRLCAFLHPDDIPEDMMKISASELGTLLEPVANDPVQLDATIAALRTFSLVRRHPETQSLSLHRLVQSILKDTLSVEKQRVWAERAVRVVNHVFPDGEQVATWPRCRQYLAHAQLCIHHIEQWQLQFPEAARLLAQVGMYLLEHAQHATAESLLRRALDMRVQLWGAEHPDVAASFDDLGGSLLYQGNYVQAEPLFKRALAIREQVYGPEYPDVAESLNNVALLYYYQGRYNEAEPLFQRALTIWEAAVDGIDADRFARTLNNLALLYQLQDKYQQAETLYLRGLTLWEQLRGPEHPDVAISLTNLALLYQKQGADQQAQSVFQRVLAIREKTLGTEHPNVAQSFVYLARLKLKKYLYAEAEVLFKQALSIYKRALGPEHPDVARTFHELAIVYAGQGRYAQAEAFFQQALDLRRRILGSEHLDVAKTLNALAKMYSNQGRYAEAEPLFQQALSIRERVLGQHHGDVAAVLKNYALLLAAMQRRDEAVKLAVRVKMIRLSLQQ